MNAIESKIRTASARNQELLQSLSETDYAKLALEQQRRYIADVENEIKQLDIRIATLEANRKKELKEHEKYQTSVMKRFAYKVSRKEAKFNEKASKEEREYFDALQEEHREKEVRKTLDSNLSDARRVKSELEGVSARHTQAQRSLDELYDSIFEGPSPGFPDEDAKEQAVHDALDQYHNIHSQMDMFGGGAMSDMMERSALSRAEITLMEARMLVDQARRMSPEVRALPPVKIAQGNLMADVFFDNIFTDMDFHEKIKQSQMQHERAFQDLIGQVESAKSGLGLLREQLRQLAKTLESARVELQQTRTEAFQRAGQ